MGDADEEQQDGQAAADGGGGGATGGRWGAAPASDELRAWRAGTREVHVYAYAGFKSPCFLVKPSLNVSSGSASSGQCWLAGLPGMSRCAQLALDPAHWKLQRSSSSETASDELNKLKSHSFSSSLVPARSSTRGRAVARAPTALTVPAAPNAAAVAALAACSPLVEVGAGLGYWARCLRATGADVLALDVCPPGPAGAAANTYHGRVPAVSEVGWMLGRRRLACMRPAWGCRLSVLLNLFGGPAAVLIKALIAVSLN